MTDLVTRNVEIPAASGLLPAYLAAPTYAGPYRAVIILHDQPGLTAHPMELTRRFARFGFVALAPDFYRNGTPTVLDRAQTVDDVMACARYLDSMERVVPRWFGLVGLGMGASYAISASARSAEFAALVALYCRPFDETDVARMQAPVLALYAESDPQTPPEVVVQVRAMFEQYFIPHELKLFPGLTHDFFDVGCPEAYDENAARDAWEISLLWLRTHLG